jgi:hypothetical protein
MSFLSLEEELLCCCCLLFVVVVLSFVHYSCVAQDYKELENQFDCLCMTSGTSHPILVLSGLSKLGYKNWAHKCFKFTSSS